MGHPQDRLDRSAAKAVLNDPNLRGAASWPTLPNVSGPGPARLQQVMRSTRYASADTRQMPCSTVSTASSSMTSEVTP
eukprot:2334366-Pyramimonas_sp.AAC.1